DRAEEVAVLARALVDREHGFGEQAGSFGFAGDASFGGAFGGLHAALRFLERARGRGLRELARHQVVAQVAGRDVDGGTALAEVLDVGQQDRLGHQRSPTYGRSAISRARFTATDS